MADDNFRFTGSQPDDPQWLSKLQTQPWYPTYEKLTSQAPAMYEAVTGKPYPMDAYSTVSGRLGEKFRAARGLPIEQPKPIWEPGRFATSSGTRYGPLAADFSKAPAKFISDRLSRNTDISGNIFYGSNRFPNEAQRAYDTLSPDEQRAYLGEAIRSYGIEPNDMNWNDFIALSQAHAARSDPNSNAVNTLLGMFMPNLTSLRADPHPAYRYDSPVGKNQYWGTGNIRKNIGLDPGIPVDERGYDLGYDVGRTALISRLLRTGPTGTPLIMQPKSMGELGLYHYLPDLNRASIGQEVHSPNMKDVLNALKTPNTEQSNADAYLMKSMGMVP